MAVDPEIAALLDQLKSLPRIETLPPAQARTLLGGISAAGPPGPALATIMNRTIETPAGPLGVRIYADVSPPSAVMVYYHGGGWTLGNLDSVDAPLRTMAKATGLTIASVDYRLAPEHPFPAAVDDALAALDWTAANVAMPGCPVFVGGDSAGANLAAVVAIMARDRGGPAIAGQLLFYPVTDSNFGTGSYRDNAEGYFLTAPMMRWFWDQYCPDAELRDDIRLSPLRAADLSNLPATQIQTAEYDPLRDEGQAFATRLREAGNDVALREGPGLIHGYFGMSQLAVARAAFDDAVDWLLARIAAV